MKITSATILVRDSEPVATVVDGEVVLFSVRAGSYFALNAIGSKIWDMLVDACAVERIYASLGDQHDIQRDQLENEVTPFLQTLVDNRLLKIVDAGRTL